MLKLPAFWLGMSQASSNKKTREGCGFFRGISGVPEDHSRGIAGKMPEKCLENSSQIAKCFKF